MSDSAVCALVDDLRRLAQRLHSESSIRKKAEAVKTFFKSYRVLSTDEGDEKTIAYLATKNNELGWVAVPQEITPEAEALDQISNIFRLCHSLALTPRKGDKRQVRVAKKQAILAWRNAGGAKRRDQPTKTEFCELLEARIEEFIRSEDYLAAAEEQLRYKRKSYSIVEHLPDAERARVPVGIDRDQHDGDIPSEKTGQSNETTDHRRRCSQRDELWLDWNSNGLGFAAIRDRWNEMDQEERDGIAPSCAKSITKNEKGIDLVKKALKRLQKRNSLE